jgi:hypothetical protein
MNRKCQEERHCKFPMAASKHNNQVTCPSLTLQQGGQLLLLLLLQQPLLLVILLLLHCPVVRLQEPPTQKWQINTAVLWWISGFRSPPQKQTPVTAFGRRMASSPAQIMERVANMSGSTIAHVIIAHILSVS